MSTPEEVFEKSKKYIDIDKSTNNWISYPTPTEDTKEFYEMLLAQTIMSKKDRKIFDKLVQDFINKK